jgi:hypothetical protein
MLPGNQPPMPTDLSITSFLHSKKLERVKGIEPSFHFHIRNVTFCWAFWI